MTSRCLALDSPSILRPTCRCSGKRLGLFFNRDGIACKSSPGAGLSFCTLFSFLPYLRPILSVSTFSTPLRTMILIKTSRSADGLSTNREASSLYWQIASINATTILLHFCKSYANAEQLSGLCDFCRIRAVEMS